MKACLTLLIAAAGLGWSCQNARKTEGTSATAPAVSENSSASGNPRPSLVKLLRADEAFIKASATQKPFPMITDSIWSFYFALSISEQTPKDNIYKGHWLDLKENGQYSKGIYGNTTDEGYFVYDPAKKSVELRSAQRDSSSEWTVKVDPDALLLIGTARYDNNPWQIKLLRRSAYPVEGVPLKNENMGN